MGKTSTFDPLSGSGPRCSIDSLLAYSQSEREQPRFAPCWKRYASMDWYAWTSKERPERASARSRLYVYLDASL